MQRFRRVELDVRGDPEAAAHRPGQQADARRGADQGEWLDRHGDRAGVHARIHRQVDLEILHRGIERFLDHHRQAVNLVDEEDIPLL